MSLIISMMWLISNFMREEGSEFEKYDTRREMSRDEGNEFGRILTESVFIILNFIRKTKLVSNIHLLKLVPQPFQRYQIVPKHLHATKQPALQRLKKKKKNTPTRGSKIQSNLNPFSL